eukprot:PhF_6_TR7966/c0_g1_i6/m.12108
MGSVIVELIVALIRFVFDLVVDLICFALLIAGLAGVWRFPFNLAILAKGGCSRRNDMRFACMIVFGCTMCDIITFPMFVVVNVTWRMPHMWNDFTNHVHFHMGDCERYEGEARFVAFKHFFLMLLDIPFIIMMALTLCTPWRGWKLVTRMNDLAKGEWLTTNFRELIFVEFIKSVIDVLTIPMGLLLLLFWYRVPIIRDEWKAIDAKGLSDHEATLEKKTVFAQQFGWLLVDIPFIIMFAITFVLGWRTRILCHAFQKETRAADRRAMIGYHFFFTLVDYIFVFPMFAVVLCSLYRFLPLYVRLRDDVQPAAAPNPHLKLTAFVPKFLPNGLEFNVVGTKDEAFALSGVKSVKLYIRNDGFWETVSNVFGATAGYAGKALLPLELVPKYFEPNNVQSGRTDFDFPITFVTNFTQETIAKSLDKLENGVVMVQIEYGKHSGTLFNAHVKIKDLIVALSSGASLDIVDVLPITISTEGEYLCEIFAPRVLLAFIEVVKDLYGIVCFFLLHLVIHRCIAMYKHACYGDAFGEKTRLTSCLEELKIVLDSRPRILENVLDHVDTEILTDQNIVADDSFYYSHSYGRYWWNWYAREFEVRPHAGLKQMTLSLNAIMRTLIRHNHNQLARAVYKMVEGDHAMLQSQVNVIREQIRLMTRVRFNPQHLSGMSEFLTQHRAVMDTKPGEEPSPDVPTIQREESVALPELSGGGNDVLESTLDDAQVGTYYHAIQSKLHLSQDITKDIISHTNDALEMVRKKYHQDTQTMKCDWESFRSVVITQTAQFGYDVIASIAFLIVFATIYRSYTVVSTVFSPETTNRRRMCLWNVGQLFVDFVYLLKVLCIFLGIRHAPGFISDVVMFTSEQKSFKAARTVIDVYFRNVLQDVLQIVSFIFAWRMLKYSVAAAVFGFFSPGVLLDSMISEEPSKGRAACILLLSCGILYGYPFAAVYGILPDHNFGLAFGIFFGLMGFVFLIALGCGMARSNEVRFTTVNAVSARYLSLNTINCFNYASLLYEMLCLWSLIFVKGLHVNAGVLNDIANAALLDFGTSWSSYGLPFGYYVALGLVLLLYVVASTPVVVIDVFSWNKDSQESDMTRWYGWHIAMHTLRITLNPLIMYHFTSVLACNGIPNALCYDGGWHTQFSICTLLLMVFYIPCCLMLAQRYHMVSFLVLEVQYSTLYVLVTN